jgi:hypothetical protein
LSALVVSMLLLIGFAASSFVMPAAADSQVAATLHTSTTASGVYDRNFQLAAETRREPNRAARAVPGYLKPAAVALELLRLAVAPRLAAEAGTELPGGYSSFKAAKTGIGSPGEGNVFDHVVEQSQIGRSGFSPEEIHNPFNMNPVSAGTNQIKANYYSRKFGFTNGGTVRDWRSGQPFAVQYNFGMKTLADIEAGLIR